jgi:HEAT repeat protein
MFRTGPIHEGPSRPFTASDQGDDARVARLFQHFPDVTDVLVATDFVAVSLRRPDRWEALLDPVLQVVTEEFVIARDGAGAPASDRLQPTSAAEVAGQQRHEGRLERAWRELGSLHADHGADLERVRAAARDQDAARRQVAASLLRDAEAATAQLEWQRLLVDRSRLVRRATVDAVVDVGREELRPLLERALGDDDAWVRWKALRGLSELGAGASRQVIQPLVADPDFRVRLEAQAAVHGASGSDGEG